MTVVQSWAINSARIPTCTCVRVFFDIQQLETLEFLALSKAGDIHGPKKKPVALPQIAACRLHASITFSGQNDGAFYVTYLTFGWLSMQVVLNDTYDS